MKRMICLALAAFLALACVGCKKNTPSGNLPGLIPDPTEAVAAAWPQDLTSLPEFSDCERIEYAGATGNGYEIGLVCTLDQLESWRSHVNEVCDIHGEFSVFHNGEYVVQLHEAYADTDSQEKLRVTLYLTEVRDMVWPEEMGDFPVYDGEGRATTPLAVDTVYIEGWTLMETTLYGETQEGLQAYLDALESAGFAWTETEDGGFYLKLEGDLACQFGYEWTGDATVTLTWAILPAEEATLG